MAPYKPLFVRTLLDLAQVKFGSLKELAKVSGVSYHSVREIHLGRYSPSIKVIDRLAWALEMPTAELFDLIYTNLQSKNVFKANTDEEPKITPKGGFPKPIKFEI